MSYNAIAVASYGGHWIQLMRLKPFFSQFETFYISTIEECPVDTNGRYFRLPDVNENSSWLEKANFVVKSLIVLLRIRPKFVISTGALPGLILIVLAKCLLRSKTVWIDSIANAETLSKSGRYAKKFSDLWLTQWPHLASDDGPKYIGRVL